MITTARLPETRTYDRRNCITFRKTAEEFGGLSNMAGGYPLSVNGVRILTSEALYQACRFPHLPDVQRMIIAERSPMTAKMRSKPYRDSSRPDWDIVRTRIMRWCLQVKLVQNWDKFSKLLLDTGDLPIVEDSRKDDFWGAKPGDEIILVGINVLGRLLMQLREQVRNGEITCQTVKPLSISDFLLYGQEIRPISGDGEHHLISHVDSLEVNEVPAPSSEEVISSDNSVFELNFHTENSSNKDPQKNPIDSAELDFNQYDSFQIMLPYIEKALATEHTVKELAELFRVPQKLMSNWLEQAIKLGKVKKLSKPTRYTVEPELPLLKQLQYIPGL
ncbi:MAG: NADAR family protein [Microcoleus sp.]